LRTFTMYRKDEDKLAEMHDSNTMNSANEPQFQGVVWDDGTVAVRWLTAIPATSVWDSLDDMLKVHGHPEYDSVLIWNA